MGIRRVGEVDIQPLHRLSCHCGSVALELSLPGCCRCTTTRPAAHQA